MLRRNHSEDLNGRPLCLCMHERGGTERLLGVIHLLLTIATRFVVDERPARR